MANLEELKNKYNELHKETGKTSNTVSTGSVLEKLKTRYNELQPEKKEEIKEKEPLISPENTELLKKFNPLIPEKRDPTDYMGLNLQMVPVEKPEPTFKQYTGPGIVDRQEEPLWRKVAKWALPEQLEKVAGLDQPMEEKTIKQRMMEIEDANQVYYRDKKFQEVLTKEIKENPKIPDDYKEPDSFVGQVIEGVESGWKGTVVPSIGYFAESTGIKIGSPDMIKWGQEFGDKMIVEFLKQPELAAPSDMKGLFDGGAGDPRAYGRIIGETIPFMGTVVSLAIAGGLIGGPFGAGAAGLGSVAVIEQGNAYKAMLDAKVAPDKAAEASAIYGAVAAIIENMFGYLPGKVAANILSPTRVATNSVKSYLLKELPKMAGRAAKKSLEEGGEEVAQQIAQDLLSGWAGSEEGMSTFKELAEQFAAGAIGSLPFGVTEFRAPQFPEETKTETKSFYIPADVAPDKVKVEPEVEVPKVELPKAKEVKKETAIEEPVAVQEAEGTTPNAIILPGSTKVRMGEGVFAKSTIDGNKITKENKKVSYSVMNGMNEGKLLISRIETQLREQNVPENDIKSIMSRIPMVENQTYTDNMFDAITAHNDSVKELSETKEIKKEFTGEEIAKEAKELGTDQDFSEHSLDQIAKENYKTKIISIKQLVETDKDLDEYLKTSKIREFEGEPFAMNPIVSSSGEVLDGYNRIAQAIANEESTIDVLYGIKKEVKEKETSKGKSFEEEIVKKKSKRISGFDIFNLSLEEAAIKHGELFDKEEIRFGIENKFDDDGTLGEYRKQRSLIYKDEYIRMILLLKKNNKTSEDVLYHEAFHAFFDTFISKVERNRALNIAKKNVPAKIASMVYSKKDYKTPEARAEELIADDFARYVANKKGVKYIGLRWLYEKIMNKLTSWVRKEAKLEKIYNDILNKKRRKGVKIDVTQREAVRSKKGVDKKVNKNIYYHGTNVQFEEFNPNANPEDYGTWFANNRKEIDDIKMKYVFEVELKPNVKLVSERKWDRIINMRKYEDLSYIEMIKETEARGIKYDNGDIQLFYPEEDLINKQTEPEFQEIEEDIIKSKKSFGKKRQAKLISGSPGASIGKFRDGTEIKLGHLDKVKAIEFPELVELAKELMGVVPSVAKMMEHKHGMFYSLERGRIKLNMDLFKQENYKQLVATLAHEIGHLIDYLPNRTLKRGNLLGRLFTLRGFLKSTFGSEGSLDLKKSGAIRNSEISAELKGVSEYWRPYDKEESTASFSAYRNSSKELYADTISMLFNDPKKLKEMAPIFYEQFFENLDRKPDVKNAYFDIQELLSHDRATLIKLRRERTREMFDRADYKAEELQRVKEAEKAVKANDYWERFTYTIRSINQPIYDKVNKIEKEGAHIPDDENPKYLLSGRNYLAGRIKAEFEDNIKPIMVNLERNGIDWKTFGEFLLYERVAEGDRSEFANPGGITPKDAKERIETLKVYYGDRYEVLVKNGKSFREFLKDVSKDAYDAELFSNELFEKFKENDKYAPFQVVEYMDNYVAWKTKTQVGTLKDVNNPANSLILKTISIIKATENQKNKVATFNFLEEYFPNEIEEAKMVYTGKGRVPVESRDKSLALSTYYEDGKLRGKYIDKYIAKSLEKDSISRNRAVMTVLSPLSYLNQKLFRPLFVIYNPGWIPFNFIRDFLRFWKNTPDLSFAGAIKRYGQAFRASRVRVYGAKEGSAEDAEALALIRKLEKEKVLNVTWNDILDGQTEEDAQIEGVMQKLGLAESKKEISSIYKPFEKIFRKTKLTKVLQGIRQVGDVIETMPKIAGYYELNGKMAPNKMGEFIRKNIGSPDFLEKGWATPATNNIFLFSNAFIQAITADSYIATNPTTRSGFWMKTAKMTYLPKILMFAALMGAFGDDLKELYEDVSEYDMTNYFIIPVGKDTNNGKTIYIRIPMDETSRLLGAVLWKLMRTGTNKQGIGKDIGDVVSLFGGQLPSVTPALSAPFAAFQFAAGQNPYDSFRGRQVLTDDQMKAGGMYALKPFLLWEFQQVGGGIFFKFYAGEQTPRQKSPGEKFLEVPLVSNVVGRFIKISDYGQLEKYWAEIDVIKAEKSRERLDENRIINSYVEKHQNNEGEYGELVNDLVLEVLGHKISSREEKTKANNLKKKFRVSIERGKSDPEINALISSSTNEEKVTLMKVYKETMSEPKFDELKKELLKYKIISGNVIRELNKAFKP